VTKKKKTAEEDKGLLGRLGPGLITGASDDDPSGIGTYSQAGAQLGFGISWTMLLTYPLMAAIQEISARIGRVTGHGIAGNVCRNFPPPVIWSLVFLLFNRQHDQRSGRPRRDGGFRQSSDRRSARALCPCVWLRVGNSADFPRIQTLRRDPQMVDARTVRPMSSR
jgi:hypothetical protein